MRFALSELGRQVAAEIVDFIDVSVGHMGWAPWGEWWHRNICSDLVWRLAPGGDDD